MSAGNKSKEIDSCRLYRLAEVEAAFSITVDELIRQAARSNNPIRLCLPLDSVHVVRIADSVKVQAETVKVDAVLKGDRSIKYIGCEIGYAVNNAVAIAVRWVICSKLKSVSTLPISVFDDVYVNNAADSLRSEATDFDLLSREGYVGLLRLNSSIEWRFFVFDKRIPKGKWLPPETFQVSKDNLCIYGFELEKFFKGQAVLRKEKKIEIAEHKSSVKNMRQDPVRALIIDAVEDCMKKGEEPTARKIMGYLKALTGKGTCVQGHDNDGIRWKNNVGVIAVLNEDNLSSRLSYLRKTRPRLFKAEHYLAEDD